jgi:hypothetical protein
MSPIGTLSPSGQTTPYSTQPNVYNSVFADAFEYTDPLKTPIVTTPTTKHINTKVKKALDDADEIEFEPQGTPNTNNASDEMAGIETIRALFHLFGEMIHDVEIAWFVSMKKVDAIEIVRMSTFPAEQLYRLMKTSDIILHGYRRYGSIHQPSFCRLVHDNSSDLYLHLW